METKQVRPDIVRVEISTHLDTLIKDRRSKNFGLVFGTIRDVANQYGIKIVKTGDNTVFEAPKPRMQVFVEKLHFSGTPYSDLGTI